MLYSTILAGGSGTRLWPLSRAGHPKFLHPLTGTDRTLLQATVDRTATLSDPSQVYVVTGTAHAAAIARTLASNHRSPACRACCIPRVNAASAAACRHRM